MPITTYLLAPPKDDVLDEDMVELLKEIREKKKEEIYVDKIKIEKPASILSTFFIKERTEIFYEILIPLGHSEYQAINLYGDGISIMNSKKDVMNYLFGCLFKV